MRVENVEHIRSCASLFEDWALSAATSTTVVECRTSNTVKSRIRSFIHKTSIQIHPDCYRLLLEDMLLNSIVYFFVQLFVRETCVELHQKFGGGGAAVRQYTSLGTGCSPYCDSD